MNKFIHKSSLLLYLLAFLVFFMMGGLYVKLAGAADGQGLASGAIVLGYCLLFSFIAFAVSIFFVHYANSKSIFITNRLLFIIFLIGLGILTFRFLNLSEHETPEVESPKKMTVPSGLLIHEISNTITKSPLQNDTGAPMGLGFFKPDFFEKPALYFYGIPNPKKSVQEHPPVDSIGFEKKDPGGFHISYAPPWLVPEHLKLDYDILYFKVVSLSNDFAEVTVNTITRQTSYIDKSAGKIIFWPDFLLQVHSVEFIKPDEQKVRIKPLSYAGEVNIPFQIMKPIMVKDEWLFVELYSDNYEQIGLGWIQWKNDKQLIISYSLLS